MELRDLQCFVAVADTGSLSRAARDVHVAQPALSRRVRALERELGVVLLTRHAKGVTLTPAGAAIAQGSQQLLLDVAVALDRADDTAAGRRGCVVLAATRAAVARGFPTDVQESLRRDYPNLTVVVQDFEPPGAWEAVADGRADVAVCMEHPALPELVSDSLWVEPLDRAIVPRTHPLAQRGTVSLPELEKLPFVFSRSTVDPAVIERVADQLRGAGLRSRVVVLERDLRETHLAVATGRGWTLVSRSRAQAPPEGTVVVNVKGLALVIGMKAVWRRGERRAAVHTVIQRMLDIGRASPGSPRRRAAALPRAGRVARVRGTVPPGVELRNLRALVAVAATHTIGRAGERLGISQPALSRRLSTLEYALGFALLERSARGVALTPAGVSLAGDAPAVLAAAERLAREAGRARRGIEGRCVIGAVATAVSSALLARVTERCLARHPGVDLLVEEMATPVQRDALARADIDLGLAHAFPTAPPARADVIVATHVYEDRLDTALLALGHPLAARRRIEPRQLADVPFLFMDRSFHPTFYDRVQRAFAALGLRPRVEATYNGLQTVWALVAQGQGWTLGFHSHLVLPPAGTAAVRIAGLSVPFGLDLLSRRDEASPPVLAVASLFRDVRRLP